jgi:hypothetical protein
LIDVSVPADNQHLERIFVDDELEEAAVIKQHLTTAAEGKSYQGKHYSLQAKIAVDFKIENERSVQFHKWANQIVKSYNTVQGWIMEIFSVTECKTILSIQSSTDCHQHSMPGFADLRYLIRGWA